MLSVQNMLISVFTKYWIYEKVRSELQKNTICKKNIVTNYKKKLQSKRYHGSVAAPPFVLSVTIWLQTIFWPFSGSEVKNVGNEKVPYSFLKIYNLLVRQKT